MERLLDVAGAAKKAGVDESMVIEAAESGELAGRKLKGDWVFDAGDVDEWTADFLEDTGDEPQEGGEES